VATQHRWISRASLTTLLSVCVGLALALAPARAHAQDDDDDDEGPPAAAAPAQPAAPEAEKKPAAPPPAATPAPAPAEGNEEEGPAHPVSHEAPPPPPPAAPAAAPEEPGYLQGRAESTSPNELIHTVERKVYTAAGHGEVTLYPAAVQLNSKFTNTDGLALAVSYAIQENVALQLMGFYNYTGGNTGFSQSLLEIHARPQAADALYLDYGAVGGFEVSPIYGKFAFYQGSLVQFRFVLDAGAGIGHTSVQLTNGPDASDPTAPSAQYGDAGYRFVGDLGVGFRLLLGSTIALRLEMRDLLYTARVDHIDGCDLNDVTGLLNTQAPTDGCKGSSFGNTTVQQTSLTVAQDLLKDVSSDVVNDVVFFLGASILF